MDSFPDNFSFQISNEQLSKFSIEKSQKQKEEMKLYRERIFNAYNKSLNNGDKFFTVILEKTDFRKDLLLELIDRFPMIYCTFGQKFATSLKQIEKKNLDKLDNEIEFIIALSDEFF